MQPIVARNGWKTNASTAPAHILIPRRGDSVTSVCGAKSRHDAPKQFFDLVGCRTNEQQFMFKQQSRNLIGSRPIAKGAGPLGSSASAFFKTSSWKMRRSEY